MGLKKKTLLSLFTIYWGVIGIGLFTVNGFGSTPFLIGIAILISLMLLIFRRNRNFNIIGTCGLYLSSILILIGISLVALFFSYNNELIYYFLFLFCLTNFITTYYMSKLSRVKNEIMIE